MVGQRKLLDLVSGIRNVSKVSPILVRYQYIGSGILSTTVHGSMVVNTANPYRSSPGSKRKRNLINSSFSQRNWRAETMGSGITSLCDGDDSLLMRRTREIEGNGKVELLCVGGL